MCVLHIHLTLSDSVWRLCFSFSSCVFSVCRLSVGRSVCRRCESSRAPCGLGVAVASWRLPRLLPPSTSARLPYRCPRSCESCARLSRILCFSCPSIAGRSASVCRLVYAPWPGSVVCRASRRRRGRHICTSLLRPDRRAPYVVPSW